MFLILSHTRYYELRLHSLYYVSLVKTYFCFTVEQTINKSIHLSISIYLHKVFFVHEENDSQKQHCRGLHLKAVFLSLTKQKQIFE